MKLSDDIKKKQVGIGHLAFHCSIPIYHCINTKSSVQNLIKFVSIAVQIYPYHFCTQWDAYINQRKVQKYQQLLYRGTSKLPEMINGAKIRSYSLSQLAWSHIYTGECHWSETVFSLGFTVNVIVCDCIALFTTNLYFYIQRMSLIYRHV